MEAGKRTIEQIFNKGRTLEIPFFQRSYVWSEENWERFLSDMALVSENNADYFMGSLILKSKPVPSGDDIGDWRVVVDGQQRLTTVILFFKILAEFHELPELVKDTFYNRRKELILKHNHNDIKIFESIINDELTEELRNFYSNNNILQCYDYFKDQSNGLREIKTHVLLNRLYFVGIDLGMEEDEQQIFDTINSLGVSLTTAELLKNELFRREDEQLYKKTWKHTFEADEDTKDFWDQKVTSGRVYRVNIDFLLQAYLLISSEAQLKYIGLERLFNSYKNFIKSSMVNKESFIDELMGYAKLYQRHIDPDFLNQDIKTDSYIERLNVIAFGLNTTTVIPYILYVLKEVKSLQEQNTMFKLLETYLIRRLICRMTTKNYNNLFASFVRNKINSYDKLNNKIYSNEDPTNLMPDDEDLKKGFEESNLTNQQAKTVLYLLEKSIRNKKHSTNVRPINEYSLEHIMPKKWRNNWHNNLSQEEAKLRDRLLLKLGNLTILTASLNSSVRDASWDKKVDGVGNNGGLKKYGSGLEIFDKYLEQDHWDEDSINSRAGELYEYAIKVWEIESVDTNSESFKKISHKVPKTRYWIIGAGEGARLWDDFLSNSIVAVAPDETGDLKQYGSKESIGKKITEFRVNDAYPTMDQLALWEFSHEMNIGDIVIVKKGLKELLAYGTIDSDYSFDNDRQEYKHVRKVKWIKTGKWIYPVEESGIKQLPLKTLTDITKYPGYPEELINIMESEV